MTTIRRVYLAVLLVIIAAVAALFAQPASAMVASDRQVVLLLDGSGSISSSDWNLQKQGIEAALQDTSVIPRDGSIAIGVVQWSNNITRVEVPLTLIDSATAAQDVTDLVLAMVQIGGGTNPGDGIRAGTNELLANGDPTGEWILCQSTDGTLNQGESLATSTAFAQASGVDRYSVIAIEDGGFTRETARSTYGPFLFGDGTVTVARNATEFANLFAGACLNPPLEVVGLEVNQAVQSLDLSVPLVAEKSTVVRAFVQTTDGSNVVTSGLLFGTRNGSPLPGSPLAATNAAGTITATGDAFAQRSDRDATLNFIVPRTWTTGDITMRFELPGGAICSDSAPPANTCEVDASFVETNRFALRPIAVTYGPAGSEQTPTRLQLTEQGLRTWTQFPIATIDIDDGFLGDTFATAPGLGDVNERIGNMRDDECALGVCDEDAYWYGVLTGPGGGLADGIGGFVSSGYLAGTGGKEAEGYARNRGPHEVAHSLGRPHAVDGDLGLINQFLWIFGGQKQGYCNEVASRDSADWPYINDINGTTYPTLGPLGDPETEIWGFDRRFTNGTEDLSVVDPRDTFPMMSYGNNSACSVATDGHFRWISDYTYRELLPQMQAAVVNAPGGGGGSWDALFVSGTIDLANETADFSNARLLPSGRVDFDTTGDFTLDVFAADGGLLDSIDFEPIEQDSDWPNAAPTGARFNVPVRLPAEPIGRVVLRFGAQVLGESLASPNVPEVAITAPAQNDPQTDDTVLIAWNGSDLDGDALTYSVFYSPDGETWRGLTLATTATSVTVPRDQLGASTNGRLLVVASDGLNSSRAERDLIVVANNAPRLDVLSPTDGDVFSGVQGIFFEAMAMDREDGALTSMTWTSDLDGTLGSGDQLVALASDLTEGTHTISVEVSDSAGATTSQEFEIQVFRIAPPTIGSLRDRITETAEALEGIEGAAAAQAASALRDVLGDEYWLDGNTLTADGEEVLKALRDAAQRLGGPRIDSSPGTPAADALDEMIEVARTLATDAVNAASDLRPQRFAQASRQLAAAETAAAEGEAFRAIDEFRKAWKVAT